MDMDGEPFISYSIREVLDDIRSEVRALSATMHAKADETELWKLQDRVRSLEHFRYKLAGIVTGASLAGGSAVTAISQAIWG